MDEIIQQVAADHLKAGRLGIAWHVEQVSQALGLDLSDANGDGPFMQEVKR